MELLRSQLESFTDTDFDASKFECFRSVQNERLHENRTGQEDGGRVLEVRHAGHVQIGAERNQKHGNLQHAGGHEIGARRSFSERRESVERRARIPVSVEISSCAFPFVP